MAIREIGPRNKNTNSRLGRWAQNTLGVINADSVGAARIFRRNELDVLDSYYDSEQYEHLQDWEEALKSDTYVSIRDRKPRIIYNIAKIVVDKVTSKLCGQKVFPKFLIEDDPDDTAFFNVVIKAASLRRNLIEPVRQALKAGSSFVRYFLINGQLEVEWSNSKYCYPKFDAVGELDEIEVKYVYEDWEDLDVKGDPKKKWYCLQLTKTSDVLMDNPPYIAGTKPTFAPVETNDHGLGWVQGEWLQTNKDKFDPDGPSLYGDILGFIDDTNYSLSQTSQAIGYNQEPQLGVKGVDEEELDTLVKSSQKAWNLGREGEAAFIETALEGVKQATEVRGDNRNRMLEVVRVVLQDPEKIAGNAQSGNALEILNAPLIELIDELRSVFEPKFIKIILKMALTCLIMNKRGMTTMIETPTGYMPESFDLVCQWPAIFPPTLADINLMCQAANTASTANVISRESLTRWLAPVFGIDDVDEELSKIATQPPPPNPFGDFGGGF